MVRFNFILSAAIGFVTALMLTTCASPSRVVWEYYDQCARENPSFLAMAECGRQKRLAECVPNNACSPEGNMFMQYIDTLVLSVKKKELTEAEAMRRYTEYKAGGTPSHSLRGRPFIIQHWDHTEAAEVAFAGGSCRA